MIANTLRLFDFAACNHIYLLQQIHAWAWRNQQLTYQIAAMNRLFELGAVRRPWPRLVWSQDDDQRDLNEEADSHGVTVLTLVRSK